MTADPERDPRPDGECVKTKRWEKPRVEDIVVQPREDVLGSCSTSGGSPFVADCTIQCMY